MSPQIPLAAPAASGLPARVPVAARAGTHGEDAIRWEAAAQIRGEWPGWVVIWVARKGEFQARPLFQAPHGTVAAAVTPQQLTAQMEAIRRAAPRRPRTVRA